MHHSILLLVSCLLLGAPNGLADERPNIIFILADDMGYGDIGCYGHPLAKTPHLDQLAKDGVRFTQHYANGPECSPTRTAFLTGRYQQRVGGLECAIGTGNVGRYDDAIRLAGQRDLGLPADRSVIPGKLQEAGYACALFGKWHLGYEPKFNPMQHGWDEFFGYTGGNVHYFNHRETSDLHVLFRGRLPVHRDGYMTHLITDDSIEFINRHKQKPFFLYVAHECPHFPYQGPSDKDKLVNEDNWMEPDQNTYVAMLEDLDAELGRLLEAVDAAGLADNTVVVFASDNGGFGPVAHMAGLRGAKGTTFEGGIRVPLIIRWPGHIEAGTTSDQVCATFDLTRSFLALAGATVADGRLEGDDILQHITSGTADYSRTMFWRGKRGKRVWSAVRHGDAKYVRQVDGEKAEEFLFDLSKDRNEQASLLPNKDAIQLKQLLRNWEAEVRPTR
ncbi:sulfatase-like hydrolase/transferase [Fuerstiella marisgermanici]|uniref:Arylsulfatase n=1 Tax=Fuerstiella marisgermanici TaxID=1891926 RepID=A0A1P8WB92_9PLAN|nr:sulfatase-like hydrolase/transferase [Fuerstiella marisgermanici]APZ91319.1 Arylsulfatase precursor [Fuerstiella marisgermanici]